MSSIQDTTQSAQKHALSFGKDKGTTGFNKTDLALLALNELNLTFNQSRTLVQHWQDAEELFFGVKLNHLKNLLNDRQISHWHHLRQEISAETESFAKHQRWLSDKQVQLITWHHPDYPKQLKVLDDGPGWLWLWGRVELLADPAIAMVGGRNATNAGLALAKDFAQQLAQAGLTVVSGLALGVDGASHEGALAAGGDTIAVLGSGLGHIYPHQHQHLAQRIVQHGGCVISPWPLFKQAVPYQFPARNRIVSGISLGVLIVEAARKSGSLITARAALEQGREVFALPSSANNHRAEGGLSLIRNGATLVFNAQQIIAELAPQLTGLCKDQSASSAELETKLQQLLNVFGYDPLPVDIICQQLALPYNEVANDLMELVLLGYLAEEAQGFERIR